MKMDDESIKQNKENLILENVVREEEFGLNDELAELQADYEKLLLEYRTKVEEKKIEKLRGQLKHI